MALQYKNIKNNLKTMISPLLTRSQVFAGYKTLGTKLILKLANVFKTHLTRNLQTRSKQRICLNCNQNKIDFVLKVCRLMLVHIPNQKGVILIKNKVYGNPETGHEMLFSNNQIMNSEKLNQKKQPKGQMNVWKQRQID